MPSLEDEDQLDATPVRDAACLILLDHTGSEPRVLMGRRLPWQAFLPNKWVFPGGRVDDDDRELAARIAAQNHQVHHFAGLLPFALAAIRELFEEAGVQMCEPGNPDMPLPSTWQRFSSKDRVPALRRLRPLARAITPPGFPRRFDTWFFVADRRFAAAKRFKTDGELLDLGWFTLDEVRDLDLPTITRLIVDDVAMELSSAEVRRGSRESAPIAFYYQADQGYQRMLIDASTLVPVP